MQEGGTRVAWMGLGGPGLEGLCWELKLLRLWGRTCSRAGPYGLEGQGGQWLKSGSSRATGACRQCRRWEREALAVLPLRLPMAFSVPPWPWLCAGMRTDFSASVLLSPEWRHGQTYSRVICLGQSGDFHFCP